VLSPTTSGHVWLPQPATNGHAPGLCSFYGTLPLTALVGIITYFNDLSHLFDQFLIVLKKVLSPLFLILV
jgi:hypothetical protein